MKLDAAKAAAPYMHPHLANVDASVSIGSLSVFGASQRLVTVQGTRGEHASGDDDQLAETPVMSKSGSRRTMKATRHIWFVTVRGATLLQLFDEKRLKKEFPSMSIVAVC